MNNLIRFPWRSSLYVQVFSTIPYFPVIIGMQLIKGIKK